MRNIKPAIEEMRPSSRWCRIARYSGINFALYAAYGGEFQTAETRRRKITEADPYALQALAFAQLGQGQWSAVAETYRNQAKIDGVGPPMAASGLGDLAAVEGRYADAIKILSDGAAADLAAKQAGRAAVKFAAIGYAELSRRRPAAAITAVDTALKHSQGTNIRFLAGRIYAETGATDKARAQMTSLAADSIRSRAPTPRLSRVTSP